MVESNQILHCHAVGDGSLALCWLDKLRQPNGEYKIVASGRRTTMADAAAYLQSDEGQNFREAGCVIFSIHGDPHIIKPVYRINENTLEIDRRFYVYFITIEGSTLPQADDQHLFLSKVEGDMRIPVIDKFIRSSVLFFLNHEHEVAAFLNPQHMVDL